MEQDFEVRFEKGRRAVYYPVSMIGYTGTARSLEWVEGDPVPEFGSHVGVDTETELITDECPIPGLVCLGIWNRADATVYIADWKNAPALFEQLMLRNVEQRYFNIGYDWQVLRKELNEKQRVLQTKSIWNMLDMQIRVHLWKISTVGFIHKKKFMSLGGCCEHILNYSMDKGEDLGELSDRLTFRRDTPVTDSQFKYLGLDCIATDCLGEEVKPQETEGVHTAGAVVLSTMTTNGFHIDMKVFEGLENELMREQDKCRKALISFGFPDPNKKDEKKLYPAEIERWYMMLETVFRGKPVPEFILNRKPGKMELKQFLVYLRYNSAPEKKANMVRVFRYIMSPFNKSLKTKERVHYEYIENKYDIGAFAACTRKVVFLMFCNQVMERWLQGADFDSAMKYAVEFMDDKAELMEPPPAIGPKKFLQTHIQNLILKFPKLELDVTPKSKEFKLTKKDHWKLDDLGIQDPFLDSYVDYVHCTKYLSTYLNRGRLKPGPCFRGRFDNIKRTGRTGCVSPNLQNYPSRDKIYPLKNIFTARNGRVLCATDFSFIESTRLN